MTGKWPGNDREFCKDVLLDTLLMFSHIKGKLSPRPFEWYGWTSAHLEKWPRYVPPPFWFHTQNIPQNGVLFLLCSDTEYWIISLSVLNLQLKLFFFKGRFECFSGFTINIINIFTGLYSIFSFELFVFVLNGRISGRVVCALIYLSLVW